ncbi:MAG TPA: M1 family metallopeptidase [Longimicrobium sp.]|nr:M1 family metallopeptidase [Longimicrobium sp.]
MQPKLWVPILSLLLPLSAAAQQRPYFQQGVAYRIEARLDEGADVLTGRARLTYVNRSPDTLDSLYLHQHLNAFRPNSAWARRELRDGNTRFQALGPEQHAFERFTGITVDGTEVRAAYPGAPDSTVAAIALPRPLRPGDSAVVVMDWQARLSTLPRRQGRAGRHFDFAQWYPRVAVYDRTGWAHNPLLPQGEFYGEFGRYDVTLDLAADQVVGHTGVVVEGDPGYRETDLGIGYRPGPAPSLGLLAGQAEAGRKRVRIYADSVIHFAWSADPRFLHDFSRRQTQADDGRAVPQAGIHVFYLPTDTAWDEQVVLRRTFESLEWLERLFGRFPYPQITNLHRLESGGTEFPMLVMNGSASPTLITHELTHQYLHGILANNEWREGWLDEGFTSFVSNWWWEESAGDTIWYGTMRTLERLERTDSSEVVDQPGAAFSSPRIYSSMTYGKASAVFRMLREMVGHQTMRRILRTYYERHRFTHVTGQDFQRVAEEVAGRDLDWFFDQWLRRRDKLDYGITNTAAQRMGDGRWRTRVTVLRTGQAWMPVALRVGGETVTLESRARRQTATVVTREKPAQAELDPGRVLIDLDRSNNTMAVP